MAQLICNECDYRGIASWPHSVRIHQVHHDEHFHGVRLRRLDRFERISAIGSLRVFIVRPNSQIFARRRAERVSRRAISEPVGEGGYDKPTFYADDVYQIVPEMRTHAILIASELRGIGLVVVERRERDAWYEWSDQRERYELIDGSGVGGAWCIAHVWVLPTFRRQGIARRLLEITFDGFYQDPSESGWVTPFTAHGFALVRRFAPTGFWHAGYAARQPDASERPFSVDFNGAA
jgi:GNAT superfamily N-acetyltransferase